MFPRRRRCLRRGLRIRSVPSLNSRAERLIRSSSASMSRRMKEIPSMHPSARRQEQDAFTGSTIRGPALRTASYSQTVISMIRQDLWRKPELSWIAKSWTSLKRKQKKRERKQKRRVRSCHSVRNTNWYATLMKRRGRSLMSFRQTKFQRDQRMEIP